MDQSSHSPPFNPFIGITIGILAVSTAAIFIRFAQATAPSLVIAAYRLSIAALILAPIALIRHRAEIRSLGKRELVLALFSGLFLSLHFAFWITSLQFTTVASSVVLVTTTPLWVALIAPYTLNEPLTSRKAAGLSLALIGVILIGFSDSCLWSANGFACPDLATILHDRMIFGDFLAVAGAIMAAAYVIIGRHLRGNTSLVSYTFLVYGMAAVILVLVTLAAREPFFGYPVQTYVWFLLLALVPQLIGHTMFNWALRYLTAAYVSITLLGEPIGSTILAYLILQEKPTLVKLIGAILILAGILVASQSEAQLERSSAI